MEDEAKVAAVLGLVLFVALFVIVGPLVTIWSLNTVFGLGIHYSFQTWIAINWLTAIWAGRKFSTKKGS